MKNGTKKKAKKESNKKSIQELMESYCDAADKNDEQLKNLYISALMLRFWKTIKEHQKSCQDLGLSEEDLTSWLQESLDYASQYQKWQDEEGMLVEEKKNRLIYAIEKVRKTTLNFINYRFEEKINNLFAIKDDNK